MLSRCDQCGKDGELGAELFCYFVLKTEKHKDGARVLCGWETGRDCAQKMYAKLRAYLEEQRIKTIDDTKKKERAQNASRGAIDRIRQKLAAVK